MPHTPVPPKIRNNARRAEGWAVLRFWNDDVLNDIDNVCTHIFLVAGKDRS
ncbi:DUF559 domain-containing protein [Rhizobium sp. P40RR-XXII]|nr:MULTISPECIES: DUF559 domain-containing protein [unclassified Rhizobium]NLR87422.1 DUF559 domain-containing protein [Rhizobium sp. P28RR-XV]NLS19209.1 DUF559 domain-containing protein [Rhizobium sp. P40RR-XXII]